MSRSRYRVSLKSGSQERVKRLVQGFVKKKVKLLALDFDQTLIDIFMSTYKTSPSLVAQHIRPIFVSIIHVFKFGLVCQGFSLAGSSPGTTGGKCRHIKNLIKTIRTSFAIGKLGKGHWMH